MDFNRLVVREYVSANTISKYSSSNIEKRFTKNDENTIQPVTHGFTNL